MRFEKITIENFRAIERVAIDATHGSMIVIAGPNGCGKSCIFDAIRFVKSAYGGYEDNEWDYWFSEFQIGRDPGEMRSILRNKHKPARIGVTVKLHDKEKLHLHENDDQIMEELAWKHLYPGGNYRHWKQRTRIESEQDPILRKQMAQIEQLTSAFSESLRSELGRTEISGEVTILPSGEVTIRRNLVLESIWRIYDPQNIGLVNYHGSHRHYMREQIGGVNLNLKTQEQQERQSTLYNYANKYANIKTQMATEFVLQMMREKSRKGTEGEGEGESLAATMKELFRRFFPGKNFEGVTVNERDELEFSVTIKGENKHDINDLSSGEKEILFGYLRLRNSAQRQSIILLDEPELHLNPKLIQGLPQFYQKHVGEDLDNQVWTVTHSDAFLREALGHSGVRVYHMREAISDGLEENQVREIGQGEEEEAIFELIGDIATYRAGGKIVIFEGENSEFDKKMAAILFPTYERRMNFISGGNKATVRRLHEALERREDGGSGLVFSIVDGDGSETVDDEGERRFTWDVYHIENYLLDPKVVLDVLRNITLEDTGFRDESEVEGAFRDIARDQIDRLVEHAVRTKVHEAIGHAIKLKGEEDDNDPAERVGERLRSSIDRLNDLTKDELCKNKLKEIADARRKVLETAVRGDDWKKEFRGRDLLKQFANQYTSGVRYEALRDMIVNTMVEQEIRPPGMLRVLEKIDKAVKNPTVRKQ